MKDRLFEALKHHTADYAEIRFETEDATGMGYRGRELDHISSRKVSGGIVRACTRGGWGIATFDSLNDLDDQVREACDCARLVGHETTQLAENIPVVSEENPAQLKLDFRGIGIDEKQKLLSSYNEILLGFDPAIETTHVGYGDRYRTVYFASSRGTYYMEERPQVTLHFSAVARDGSLVQKANESFSAAVTYGCVLNLEEQVETVARRAVELLKAIPCEGGTYTVILDQDLGGVFAHEAFGHLSEADFLYENPKMRDLMTIGREMGVKELNIVDDGSMKDSIGSQLFDDEGTPMQKTYLIREGVLAGHLHSLETTAKMGEAPTGNARAIDRSVSPIVRMTNTYVEPGNFSFQELIAPIDKGIYSCGAFGGQTMMEMFTFSAAYGRLIEKGKIGELVRDVVLTGNVFQTLHNIDGFGNDLKIFQKGGGCGKNGQSPLPVGIGAPHLRIHDVMIGGNRR